MSNVLSKIIKVSIYLAVFLLPFFWLPFSFEVLELNKQYLLFFLVSIGAFAWLAKMVIFDKAIKFKKSPINFLVLALLVFAILSAVFSVDRVSSLFGFYGKFSDGLISLISLTAFYFLVVNNVAAKKGESEEKFSLDVSGLLKALSLSSLVAVLMSYLSIFGVKQLINPVSASFQGLAIFLAIIEVLVVGLILSKEAGGKIFSAVNYLLLFSGLILLLIIDFNPAWIILLGTFVVFTIFALVRRVFQQDVNKLLLPIFLAILSLVFIFVNLNQYYPAQFKNLPREQVLDQKTSWQIGLGSAISNVKSGFLGSGIGTFYQDFSKFKTTEFNSKPVIWQFRFDRAGNYFAEILGTMGFLGIISYALLIALFLLISWLFIKKQEGISKMPLLIAFIAILIGQFVYYQNTALAFLFWLVLGLGAVSMRGEGGENSKYRIISFKDFPEIGLVLNLLLIIFGLGILGTYFFAVRFYLADVNYAKVFQTQDTAVQIDNLEKTISFNPYRFQYYLVLGRLYLNQAIAETAKPQAEQDAALVQKGIARAIELGGAAVKMAPNYVVPEETLGAFYRDAQLIVSGTASWGIKSFERAITLDPVNPVLYTELGKLYLAVNETEKAKGSFNKALELKNDYLDARIQEILMFERENKLPEAIKELEDLVQNYSFDQQTISSLPEILFQLGRLYFNNNQTNEAVAVFERMVTLFPTYSNAYYSLGVAYTKIGERERAISAFEKVLELNPGNQDVIQKLSDLKGSL